MIENKYAVMEEIELNEESFDFESLEQSLEYELSSQMEDLEILEKDRNMIGNPSSLGESVMNVVWEQFINQVGVIAGEDFIKENRGLTLDLSDDAHIITIDNYGKEGVGSHNFIVKSEEFIKKNHNQTLDLSDDAHIQTTENFIQGKIATHNHKIDYQKRHDDYQNNFQRNEDGTIKTRPDRRSAEEVAVLRDNSSKNGDDYNHNYDARGFIDKGRPKGSASVHKDHTIPAAEIIRDPEAAAHLSREEQASFANSETNLVDLDASANMSKNDSKMEDWLDSERNGQKPAERFNINEDELRERDQKARKEYEKLKAEGEQRSIETGKETQKEEETRSIEAGKQSQKEEAFRIGGKALRAVLMGLLAELIKNIIQKLITWFRSGKKNIKTFIESVKEAIYTFIKNLKQNLITAGYTLLTTIATAIIGPVVNTIKKVWIFLKQGYKSLREAIDYVRNSKEKPFSILMLEVGKIVIAGLTAGGAMLLGETIEKGLITIPIFAFEIPFLGSLASILGIFFGALIAGIIGAIALNLIDKAVAKKQKTLNTQQQIDKKNEILHTQDQLIIVSAAEANNEKMKMAHDIVERHKMAVDTTRVFVEKIKTNEVNSRNIQKHNNDILDSIDNMLDNL